jgi:hypothetical protein
VTAPCETQWGHRETQRRYGEGETGRDLRPSATEKCPGDGMTTTEPSERSTSKEPSASSTLETASWLDWRHPPVSKLYRTRSMRREIWRLDRLPPQLQVNSRTQLPIE